jgi:hypothetical protein
MAKDKVFYTVGKNLLEHAKVEKNPAKKKKFLQKQAENKRNWIKWFDDNVAMYQTRVLLSPSVGYFPTPANPVWGSDLQCYGTVIERALTHPSVPPSYLVRWDNGHKKHYRYNHLRIVTGADKTTLPKPPKNPNQGFVIHKNQQYIKNKRYTRNIKPTRGLVDEKEEG